MKIGIDLDDVVFDFTKTFLKFYSERYNNVIKFEDVKTYYFNLVFDLPLKKIINLIEEMALKGIVENLPVCDYAQEAILNLSDNHEIIFITSRMVQKGTLESLNKLFPKINFKLIYSSNSYAGTRGKTKSEICCEEGIDIMIEDSKEYAGEIASCGIKIFLLDKPWNQNQEHENIIRVNNWKEILEEIENGRI